MKKRNRVPSDEARIINASGDRPIDHLDSRSLDRHLENLFVYQLGLKNSFGVDLRSDTFSRAPPGGSPQSFLFNYLSEIPPLLEGRVKQLPKGRREAYAKLEDAAVSSFWEVYYRFQPLIHSYARRYGVEVDDLGNVLGRAILLYDKRRGFKFYSYLKKTLRESIKNLRGQMYAEKYCLPLSAGRLMPQLLWMLDQETLRLQRRLSPEEGDRLVIDFLRDHRAHFSESTMRTIAGVARTRVRKVSLNANASHRRDVPGEAAVATDSAAAEHPLDAQDEYEHTLRRIHEAIRVAGFDAQEQAIVLERLDLAHDEELYSRIESELSAGSLRNRKMRLLVRFMVAMYAGDSPRFGRFIHAQPQASRTVLRRALDDLADTFGMTTGAVTRCLLNWMSLRDSVYRLSIAERGRLERFLSDEPLASKQIGIDGHVYNKLKAALMEQDRLDFPCLSAPESS